LSKRFARRGKGISTILGAGYFIIIMLAIFNLIMWEVNQYDAYQTLVNQMNQVDQERISENLESVDPGITDFGTLGPNKCFNLTVRNTGGITVSIARLYFYNCSDTSSSALKIIEKGAAEISVNYFTNGFINPGEGNHKIRVVTTLDMSKATASQPYIIYLVTERGRTFSTVYPTAVLPSQGNVGFIDIGPLRFVFDYYSLNYTSTAQHTPAPGWVINPYNKQAIMFHAKVINTATDSDIKLTSSCVFDCFENIYGGASGKTVPFYIVDKDSTWPGYGTMFPYDEVHDPYILPKNPNPNNPQGGIPVIIKFGSQNSGTADSQYLNTSTRYLVLMGFFYVYKGQNYGVTIPFVAIETGCQC
jgi:hypothetical protein